MAKQVLFENQTADGVSAIVKLTSSQVEIVIGGDLGGGTVTLEDRKYGLTWSPVLDSNTGDAVSITEPTNELELIAATNAGREIRATLAGSTNPDLTMFADDGI